MALNNIEREKQDKINARMSLVLQANNNYGICETLRLIYDEVYPLPKSEFKTKITDLLVEVMLMAKKMNKRLLYYQKTYHDTTGHGGKNIKYLDGIEVRKSLRETRKI